MIDRLFVAGEVAEWPKAQHWKCCSGLKPAREFESRPLRSFQRHEMGLVHQPVAARLFFLLAVQVSRSAPIFSKLNRNKSVKLSRGGIVSSGKGGFMTTLGRLWLVVLSVLGVFAA